MPKSVLGRVKSESAPRVFLIDAHSVYRAGLRSILTESMPGAEVFESGDLAAGLCQLASVGPLDLVLIDLDLSTLRSVRQLRETFEAHPQTRFAIISGADSRESILASLSVGFHGFVSKQQLADEVLAAINDIASGRIYVPPMVATPGEEESPPAIAIEMNIHRLTPRQREVLSLLVLGKSNKEIGRVLHIAEATAKVHTGALLRALRARNRTEVAVKARRLLEALDGSSHGKVGAYEGRPYAGS